jgi:hypothetical protein
MPLQNISLLGKRAMRARVVLWKIHRRNKNILGAFVSELYPEILLTAEIGQPKRALFVVCSNINQHHQTSNERAHTAFYEGCLRTFQR